jgi:hypothetical protein
MVTKTHASLTSWEALNTALLLATEETAVYLLEAELEGARRPTFARRIHSRINKLRADRERRELEERLK